VGLEQRIRIQPPRRFSTRAIGATINMKGTVVVERSAVSDYDLAWGPGTLVFRDAPLILVGAELYRWYGLRPEGRRIHRWRIFT